MSTAQQIITDFELQIDDTTDLSSDEELRVLNKVARDIYTNQVWEFLKKAYTTTTDSNQYVSLPSDFQFILQNNNYTDSSFSAKRPVVFVGSNYSPYQVVSWSDRRQYRDQDGYCYVDIVNLRLYFTKQLSAGLNVEFDYQYMPEDLTISDTPTLPSRFHDIFKYAMAVEDSIIQQSDKAKSYAPENRGKYKEILQNIQYWNSKLTQM